RAGAAIAAESRDEELEPRLAELAHRLKDTHQEVRRRRAEPPPTVSREIVATRRVEGVVLGALGVTIAAATAFVVLYVAFPDTQLLGLCLGIGALGIALAAVVAGKRLVPREKAVTEYHWFGDEESQADVEEIVHEAGEGVSRRRLLLGAAGLAGLSMAGAAVLPAASLGPRVDDRIRATPWRPGRRLVRRDGTPIRADEVTLDSFLLALPEGADARHSLAASVNVLRFPEHELVLPAGRRAGAPAGIVAYSRICTHAGCAVSMYRAPLYRPTEPGPALVCPCHYSTFDPRRGGAVEFGPAARPLPQLPLRINAAGELEATGDLTAQPGPSYSGVRRRGPST
ncbi:MAG: Rieske 2Fe-2S domain-containing protein, partial [Actinomycetota bacterium]|nr:Rieske 2Fe-2S domain-containing protein [Actinomycetota bacterium]